MSDLLIQGGCRLQGEMPLQGAKNSVLPILAATVLVDGPCRLHGCPQLSDVDAMLEILQHLGCTVQREGERITVDAAALCRCDVPWQYMRRLRCSVVFLGALTARCGQADLAYPGGCDLGTRPIDYHLSVLRRMGVSVFEEGGHIVCRIKGKPGGTCLPLAFPSVGATETAILLSVLAQGVTTVIQAAREPEIADLCRFLQCCGARIRQTEDGRLEIEGVSRLNGCSFHIMPDRIAAVTYLAAAAVTGGDICLRGACPRHLEAVLPLFEQAGCHLQAFADRICLQAPERLQCLSTVRTMPYPGFPSDAGPLFMAMACHSHGSGVFIETVFENRYRCVSQLRRMGADIEVDGRVAVVHGVQQLQAAEVVCTDLRGGAALLLAALCAQGTTRLTDTHHLDRGYQTPELFLQQLGAKIERS